MIFTHDTEVALAFVAALADTSPEASDSGAEELSTPAELGALLTRGSTPDAATSTSASSPRYARRERGCVRSGCSRATMRRSR